jgi:hypothetical protein
MVWIARGAAAVTDRTTISMVWSKSWSGTASAAPAAAILLAGIPVPVNKSSRAR